MSRTKLVAFVSLALVPFGLAASLSGQPPKQDTEKSEQDVRTVDRAEAAAVLVGDVPALEKLWAEDFVVNAPSNQVTKGRKEVFQRVKDGLIDYESFERNVEAEVIHGDAAILMGAEKVKAKGKAPLAGQTVHRRFLNVWMKRDGRWQLTARQATIIGKE